MTSETPATPSAQADFEQRMVKAAIASAVNAIIIIESGGRIRQANPATEKLFGYPAAQLLGENISILMPEPYRSAHDRYLQNYLTSGERKIIGIGREVMGRRHDGTTFPMHLSVGEFEADDAAMMGARLTDRLLTFARRRSLDAVIVNVNELLLGMMDLLRRTLGEVVSLSSSLAPDLWPVRADLSEDRRL